MIGRKNIECDRSDLECRLDATIHWCLICDRPLSKVPIKDATPCRLRGMVQWQSLNMFLKEENYAIGNEKILESISRREAEQECLYIMVAEKLLTVG